MKELLISVPGLLSNDQVADAVATAIRIDAVSQLLASVAFATLIIGGVLIAYKVMLEGIDARGKTSRFSETD